MNTGLFILRQIQPNALLAKALVELPSRAHPGNQQLIELEDGTFWVSDDDVRDVALNHTITGWEDQTRQWNPGCTVAFGIFDLDWTKHATYKDRKKAEAALASAKPRFITEFDDLPESDTPEPAPAEEAPARRRKPFEA